jgi:hypothetical protein
MSGLMVGTVTVQADFKFFDYAIYQQLVASFALSMQLNASRGGRRDTVAPSESWPTDRIEDNN